MERRKLKDSLLASWRRKLEHQALSKGGETISTHNQDQAAIAVRCLFRSAQNSVRILTAGLNSRIYGEESVISEAIKFVTQYDSCLEILTLHEPKPMIWDVHPLLSRVSGFDNVSLNFIDRHEAKRVVFHFITADDNAYRFKSDITSHKSIVCFGDSVFATQLNQIFQNLSSMSTPVPKMEFAA